MPNNQIQESVANNLIPPENKNKINKKTLQTNEEEKVIRKESNFEDSELNLAMIAAFGPSKKPNIQMSTKDNVFLKLGRSLSVDYKHKYKASKNSDASQEQFKQPYPYQLGNFAIIFLML